MTIRAVSGGWIKNGRGSAGGASLSLNFLNGITDFRITYSGGTNGTRVNEAGLIVAAVAPRYDYNPVTLAARGLLVEEARTNRLLRSGELANAAWYTAGGITVVSGALDPAGGSAGVTITDTDGAAFSGIGQNLIVTNDSTTTVVSFYLKQGTAAFSTIRIGYLGGASPLNYDATIDWSTKAVIAGGSAVAADVAISLAPSGYYRVSVRGANNSTGNTTFQTALFPAGPLASGDTGSCIAWGAQNELGSFPTSYIPTTTAAVTRTADSAVMTGADFSSWYNQSEGTFVFGADTFSTAAEIPIFTVQDSPLNDSFHRASILFASQRLRYVASNGPTQADIQPVTTITAGAQFKGAFAYATNDFAACLNAGTVATDASGSVPTDIAQMVIGGGGYLTSLNGHIQTIQYFPRRSANTQLQAMTL